MGYGEAVNYWEDVKVNAAISALQGVLESGTIGEILELSPEIVAKQSVRLANALVAELQRNKDNKSLEEEIKEDTKKIFKKNAE
jgi:hypothetical protein